MEFFKNQFCPKCFSLNVSKINKIDTNETAAYSKNIEI